MNPLELHKGTIPYLDLRVRDDDERRLLLAAIEKVLQHGRIVLGPEVEQLERALANQCGRQFAVGVCSGTGALYVALRACSIGPGCEVIVPAFSFVATANAVAMTGAKVVFADVRDDLNVDPKSVAARMTSRTRAVVAVHLTGLIADMPALEAITREHGVVLLEDAAQSFGATAFGRPAGSFGALGCFSMNGMKVLASIGEAGAVVGDDAELHERIQWLRYNGIVNKERCAAPSLNFRLDTVQAAVLCVRFRRVDALLARRRAIAARFDETLSRFVSVPTVPTGATHSYYTYVIRTPAREPLREFLGERGIETKVHFPKLIPDEPAFAQKSQPHVPNARRLTSEVLSLPNHEKLSDSDVSYIIDQVSAFFQ